MESYCLTLDFSTLILPAGVPEMETFTSADAKFFLNGISDLDKRMSFGMDSVRRDPITGLNVGTYRGCVDYLDGQLSSQTVAGGLTREVTFVTMHNGTDQIVDLMSNTIKTCPGDNGKVTFRVVKCHVSSAVLGVSGSGASVVGYPTTSTFSQPTSPEKTMIQLRSYLGAYLTQPENVVRPLFDILRSTSVHLLIVTLPFIGCSSRCLFRRDRKRRLCHF